MKTTMKYAIGPCAALLGLALTVTSCAAVVPPELVSAREAYRRASTGPANESVPADVHIADKALARAEKSFDNTGADFQTRDLAYVAQRKAELAETNSVIANEKKGQERAKKDFEDTQGRIVLNQKADLTQSASALANSQRDSAEATSRLDAEKTARAEAEARAAQAQAALAKLAAVKDEPRGLVITLSGSVLFASNRSELLPSARSRLDQVAEVLLSTRERNITVEGYTDSQGSDAHNLELSQRRADAVRDFLVQKEYQRDRIQARGMGEASPVADNGNAEGRANNRRVEIIIARDQQTSSR